MPHAIKLLDKYKDVCGLKTDMAAAEKLGLGRAAISTWRTGKSMPGPEHIDAICKAIGEPVEVWLPLIEAERTSDPKASAVWLRLTKAAVLLGGTGAAIAEIAQLLA